MVEVVVSRLGLDSGSNSFVVILQEKNGDRILPIWIGRAEAESIAAHLDGVLRERPMTHDLARSLIVALGGELQSVNITRVQDGTFFAEMHLLRGAAKHVVDSRPSDSIAIAVRLGAPIFAAEELLAEYEAPSGETDAGEEEKETGPDLSASSMEAHMRGAEQLKRHLERLRPEDFGKFTL
ncbi:MAG TPA: bifunctional nuclease family protein [Gemmatimonadaceae bacterium]|nr:bifunctional nuclease family protein [Gemmatimonadaceae bacterium]